MNRVLILRAPGNCFARLRNTSLSLLCVLSFLAMPLFAQIPPARLTGTVSGPRYEKLSSATLRLSRNEQPQVAFKTSTNDSGRFVFEGISAGTYTLEVRCPGMQTLQERKVDVRSGMSAAFNITLAAAGASQGISQGAFKVVDQSASWGSNFSSFALHALPKARNAWSLLESQEPSTVTNRLDIGGLESGVPALFGTMGASWTENEYEWNGFDVTDPYVPGRPLLDPDPDSLSEFQVITAAKPAWVASSGVSLELAAPEPTERIHGATRFFYSGDPTSSDNLDARLRRFNFPGPERLDHLFDGGVELGGKLPLAQASWPALISLSTQQLGKHLGGFDSPINVHVYRALAELSPLARENQRLNLLYSGQHIFNSREGASLLVQPSAATLGNDNYHQFQARWDRTLSSRRVFSLGFGAVRAITSSGFQPGLHGSAILNLPLMIQGGPAALATRGTRSRYQLNSLLAVGSHRFAGEHTLTVGGEWDRSEITNLCTAIGGMEQILVDGLGAEITRWNAPAQASAHTQNLAAFVDDAWQPRRWLRIPFGMRLERSSGQAAGASNSIGWTSLEPRVGLVLPVGKSGMVLRASWSRYAHLLQGRYLDFGNPAALSGQTFLWRDFNLDGVAEPGEILQRLQVFGGAHSAVDRNLARPFTDEISVGLEREFRARFRASARIFRRDDHRLIALANVGVPFSSYTPVSFLDPGNDGVASTADDQMLTLYNRNPAALGQDFFLLTNPAGDHASFKGFEIRLTKPLERRWSFSASFTGTQTHAPTSPGNSVFENDTGVTGSLYSDPNTLLFADSRTYFDRAFIGKATGYYLAPRRIQLAAVVKYYDGQPFGRMLFVNGFNQGPFFVRATPRGHPGGFQTQFNFTLDVRVAREFELRRGTLSGYLDFFNALNMNRNTLEADLTGPSFQSRVPLAVESPRAARLGAEWRF